MFFFFSWISRNVLCLKAVVTPTHIYIYIYPRQGLQKKRRDQSVSPLGDSSWLFSALLPLLVWLENKWKANSLWHPPLPLGSRWIWTEVAFWDKGTWGVVTVMSSAWELNRDMCWWLSALHWVCRMSDGSASCVFSILQVWAENYGASPPVLWLWLMTI